MNKTNRFFTFVIVFSLFMGAAFASSALLISAKLITTKQLQQKALIEQLLLSHFTENAKLLSKQLRSAVDFEYLTISDTSNNVLYRYIKPPEQRPALAKLLKYFDLYTSEQRLKSNQGNLLVEFQSSYSHTLEPLTLLIAVALFAPIMMLLLIYNVAEYVQDKRLKSAAALLEQQLLQGHKIKTTSTAYWFKPFLPLLANLEQQNKDRQSQVSKVTNKLDSTTGLATMKEFIHFYRTKVKVSGHFIVFRLADFYAIESHKGKRVASSYVQLTAKYLWQTFSFANDCHIYRLNDQDFGIVIFDRDRNVADLLNQAKDHIEIQTKTLAFNAKINTALLSIDPELSLDQLLLDTEAQLNEKT